jgi:hypothetical protein
MLHKSRTWQVSDWNLTLEQMAEIARESDWNFCLCQAFHLVIDGREIYLLNDSNHADPLHYFQEYAPVVVTSKRETAPGQWLCAGVQIESLTVNMKGGKSISELLARLGNPANDCNSLAILFEFHLDRGDKHICLHCA